jgi:polyisoprenoid-binding protein YceI
MKRLAALLMFLPCISFAQTKVTLDKSEGKTEFIAIGNPGFLKINGHGSGPKGQVTVLSKDDKNTLNGVLEIDLNSLDTGMKLRNTHMKEKYLEVETYPSAILRITNQSLVPGWDVTQPVLKKQKLKAELEIHGEKKEIEVNYDISKAMQLSAAFEIKITDFKIPIPSFMGVTVADKVQVKINSKLKN